MEESGPVSCVQAKKKKRARRPPVVPLLFFTTQQFQTAAPGPARGLQGRRCGHAQVSPPLCWCGFGVRRGAPPCCGARREALNEGFLLAVGGFTVTDAEQLMAQAFEALQVTQACCLLMESSVWAAALPPKAIRRVLLPSTRQLR